MCAPNSIEETIFASVELRENLHQEGKAPTINDCNFPYRSKCQSKMSDEKVRPMRWWARQVADGQLARCIEEVFPTWLKAVSEIVPSSKRAKKGQEDTRAKIVEFLNNGEWNRTIFRDEIKKYPAIFELLCDLVFEWGRREGDEVRDDLMVSLAEEFDFFEPTIRGYKAQFLLAVHKSVAIYARSLAKLDTNKIVKGAAESWLRCFAEHQERLATFQGELENGQKISSLEDDRNLHVKYVRGDSFPARTSWIQWSSQFVIELNLTEELQDKLREELIILLRTFKLLTEHGLERSLSKRPAKSKAVLNSLRAALDTLEETTIKSNRSYP